MKTVSASELEVFILTHNRSRMLQDSIDSLLRQSARGFRIVVLDNCSSDNTEELVRSYRQFDVGYIRNERDIGATGNFTIAQELAERKWAMLFHDDDILHPDYIKRAMAAVNDNERTVLVGSVFGTFPEKDPSAWPALEGRYRGFDGPRGFAAWLFAGWPLAFSSVIYKTSVLKRTRLRSEVFGKISDRPLLMDVASCGSVVVFTEPYVRYRVHSEQDSKNHQTGPFRRDVISLVGEYGIRMGRTPFSRSGRAFLRGSVPALVRSYFSLPPSTRGGLARFLVDALTSRALCVQSIVWAIFDVAPMHLWKKMCGTHGDS